MKAKILRGMVILLSMHAGSLELRHPFQQRRRWTTNKKVDGLSLFHCFYQHLNDLLHLTETNFSCLLMKISALSNAMKFEKQTQNGAI